MSSKRKIIAALTLVATALALVASARSVEDLGGDEASLDVQFLPSAEFLEKVSLGYKNLAADLVWFLTVQYYGEAKLLGKDIPLFRHLIDTATRLDPQFSFAYSFGSLILSEELGDFDSAIELLKRGMVSRPEDWTLPFETGFLYYIHEGDYEAAASYFERSSRLPDAPDRAKRFAAYVHDRAGHTLTSILMWKEIYESTDNPLMRDLAERNLKELVLRLQGESEEDQETIPPARAPKIEFDFHSHSNH